MSLVLLMLGCGLLRADGAFKGDVALHVELEGSGATASTDGPILVTRLEKLGARATSTAPAPDRIALDITSIRDAQALQLAIRPNRLEIVFPDGQILTSADISSAEAVIDEMSGRPQVNVVFTDAGGKRFCELTGKSVRKQVPMRVDGTELSAPMVMEAICGGEMVLAMGGTGGLDEAHSLAVALGSPVLASDWTLSVLQ